MIVEGGLRDVAIVLAFAFQHRCPLGHVVTAVGVARLQCTQRSQRQVTSRTPQMLICLQQGNVYPHETDGRNDMRSGDRSIRNEARSHASAATACLAGP